MRITKQQEIKIDGFSNYTFNKGYDMNDVVNKLGQLEDIEEIIEKMYKQPIYEKYDKIIYNIIREEDYTDSTILYNFKNNSIEIYEYEFVDSLAIKDYGKTWAFTREELEDK